MQHQNDPMDRSNDVVEITVSDEETARKLIVDIEHLGIDTEHISVPNPAAGTLTQQRAADDHVMSRPASRAALGGAIGLVIGALAMVALALVVDVPVIALLLAGAIAGASIGALAGYYSRMPLNREMANVEGPLPPMVTIDLRGLDEDTRERIREMARTASR